MNTRDQFRITTIAAFILFTIPSFTSPARQASAPSDSSAISRRDAIQFHLVGGYALSYVSFSSEQSALRFTGDVSYSGNSLEGPMKSTSPSNFQNTDETSEGHSYAIDVTVSYLHSLDVTDNTFFYFGLGPSARYARTYQKNTYTETASTNPQPYNSKNENRTTDWGIGIRVIAGVESSLSSDVSVLAEYQLSGFTTWSLTNYKSSYWSGPSLTSYTTDTDRRGWQVVFHSIKLGIAVHFLN